ncbi:MAG: hypothetical protein HQK77_07935 [Desulfobacterales bacterium]|nr:hypothetical protein [Desulfobacterales bacterium]
MKTNKELNQLSQQLLMELGDIFKNRLKNDINDRFQSVLMKFYQAAIDSFETILNDADEKHAEMIDILNFRMVSALKEKDKINQQKNEFEFALNQAIQSQKQTEEQMEQLKRQSDMVNEEKLASYADLETQIQTLKTTCLDNTSTIERLISERNILREMLTESMTLAEQGFIQRDEAYTQIKLLQRESKME